MVHHNEQLTAEVERLADALSSATAYIEDTTDKYAAMRQQLLNSEAIIERLSNENSTLTKQVMHAIGHVAAKHTSFCTL